MQQYFARASKSLVLRHGPPSYDEFDSLVSPEETARVALYSENGAHFAYSTAKGTTVLDPETRKTICEIPESAADMYFSPLGHFLVTWNRAKKDAASGNWIPNLKVWSTSTGEFVNSIVQLSQGSFRGGWHVQFTADEQFCVQQTGPKTLTVTDAKQIGQATRAKLGSLTIPDGIADFSVSRGKNPAVSVFVASTKGKPASIRVYKLPTLTHPVAQRTLFKAESVLTQWNKLGTALLVVAQTDVDESNKSYYGESTLYLLNVNSGADQRIMLDREGPVYDVAWSPESDEFGVVYGLMPSKTSFFDVRGNEVRSLPLVARNSVRYSPQGRFVVVSGFGNLQGQMEIYDRAQNFAKVGAILATNSSYYDWSPCGRFLLTATTSPRLRVDNGVKLWHYTGKLVYVHDDVELYAVSWRPQTVPLNLNEPVAEPHESALKTPAPAPPTKPQGAYMPPHARLAGSASRPTRSLYEATSTQAAGTAGGPKGKNGKKPGQPQQPGGQPGAPLGTAVGQKPEEKQIRSLVKKLRAIDELKVRQAAGDKLEATQVQKIGSEEEVLKKLQALGWSKDSEQPEQPEQRQQQ